MRRLGLALVLATSVAHANGRPPLTNGIHFNPSDPHTLYVASTFGLLISHDDGCTMSWICEDNLGYGGVWDPKYSIATDGTIFATTFTGLRVSRDGGCSFTTATDTLAAGDPGRIAGIWIDALDIGPTGDVWVGTAESGAPNDDVRVAHDNGMSFTATGMQSPTIFWKSVKVAPSNMMRVYISGYEVNPPTGHVLHTDNGGAAWSAIAVDRQWSIQLVADHAGRRGRSDEPRHVLSDLRGRDGADGRHPVSIDRCRHDLIHEH